MLRLWVIGTWASMLVWSSTLQEHRKDPSFLKIYQEHQQQEHNQKNLLQRLWHKIQNLATHPTSTQEYDLFTWWWVKECLRNPSLDPTGAITFELLCSPKDFGGWYHPTASPQGVETEQLKLYESAAFLFYWHHHDISKPTKGPSALSRLWKEAQDKQCLWVEPHLINPTHVDAWLKAITPEDWQANQETLHEAIQRKFACKGGFEKELGPKWLSTYGEATELTKWLGNRPYRTLFDLFEAMQKALKHDDIPPSQQRNWFKNILTLYKVMSPNEMHHYLERKDASYLGCLNIIVRTQPNINSDDIKNFREFLRIFDPSQVDVEKNLTYLQWLSLALQLSFHYKWQTTHTNLGPQQISPIEAFTNLYQEEADRGLWPQPLDKHPYWLMLLSLNTHSDVDTENLVYKTALMRTLRKGYDLHHITSLSHFLWDYIHNIANAPEAIRPRYVALQSCTVGDKSFQEGDILEPQEAELITPDNKDQFKLQNVKIQPYNIDNEAHSAVTQQNISMAIDYLFAQGVWPEDHARGLVEASNKLAIMLLIFQRMTANKAE